MMTKNQAISVIDGYQQALEDFAIAHLLKSLKLQQIYPRKETGFLSKIIDLEREI